MLRGIDTRVRFGALIMAALFVIVACGEESSGGRRRGRRGKKDKSAQKVEGQVEDKGPAPLVLPELSESSFISNPKHRDPFHIFTEVITHTQEIKSVFQREVKLKEYDISELRLIGIITNIGNPRAMVVIPDGTGFVLRRGDYVGRADFLDTGAGAEKVQVNWRVARIHGTGTEKERGLYLVREDPTAPAGKKVTRFMPLHPEGGLSGYQTKEVEREERFKSSFDERRDLNKEPSKSRKSPW